MPYYTVPRGATVRHRSSDIDPNAISKRYSQAFVTDILVFASLVWLKLAVLWWWIETAFFQMLNDFAPTWVKVQNFQNPELKKFKFLNLHDAYKNE